MELEQPPKQTLRRINKTPLDSRQGEFYYDTTTTQEKNTVDVTHRDIDRLDSDIHYEIRRRFDEALKEVQDLEKVIRQLDYRITQLEEHYRESTKR